VGENEWAGEEAVFRGDDFSASAFDFSSNMAAETAPISSSMKSKSIGTAMHGFFEHLDFGKPERFLEPETLERVFGRFGKDAVSDARKIIQDFMKQPVFLELRKARQVKREIDFVLNERRGLIHGKIDLLFEGEEGGWHILDYKTAVGDDEAARKSAYDLQMEIYALAAERILKLPVRSAVIYYLKNQKAVTLHFPDNSVGRCHCEEPQKGDAAISLKKGKIASPLARNEKMIESVSGFFDGLEKKICSLQQKILDYSNERMSKERESGEGS